MAAAGDFNKQSYVFAGIVAFGGDKIAAATETLAPLNL